MTYMYEPTGISLLHSTNEPSADAHFREELAHEDHKHLRAEQAPSLDAADPHIIERMWARIGSFHSIA
ncbi:MAG: hypothetical protein ABI305_01395 [Tepidiformaceae bacterium]